MMSEAKGLLVLRLEHSISEEQHAKIKAILQPVAEALGVRPMVCGEGVSAELTYDHSPQLDRICSLLEELVKQGRAPELSEAEIELQALQSRQPSEKEMVSALSEHFIPPAGLSTRG